jgi:hypothetical protein
MADRSAWLAALAAARIGPADSAEGQCPQCGREWLRARYIADQESRLGYVLFWCDACLHGISVSRVRAPQGAPIWSLDDPESTAGVPEFQRDE